MGSVSEAFGDDTFIKATDVAKFVHDYALSRYQFTPESDLFKQIINDLETKQKEFETAEQEMYQIFQVKDLKELQQRVDMVNSSGLLGFSNKYLKDSSSDLTKNLKEVSNEEFLKALTEYLLDGAENRDTIVTGIKADDIDIENIIRNGSDIDDMLISAIRSAKAVVGVTTDKSHPEPRVMKRKSFKILLEAVVKYMHNGEISKAFKGNNAYKGDLTAFLVEKERIKNKSTFELTVPDALDSINGIVVPSYYPYFMLTQEQEKHALGPEGDIVWDQFKTHIANVANIDFQLVSNIMESIGRKNFFKRSINEVVGILGELQMLFIVALLRKDGTEVIASGPLRNLKLEGQPELGADVLLNKTLGMQVKNYNLIRNSIYQIKKDFKFDYLYSKFEDNPYMTQIGKFYTAVCFNQVIDEDQLQQLSGGDEKALAHWKSYKGLYEQKLDKRTGDLRVGTQAFFMSNLDHFLTFEEAYEIAYQDIDSGLKQTYDSGPSGYKNAFFFFGGTTVVPVSYMIRLLKNRLQKFVDDLLSKNYQALYNFYLTFTYNGDDQYRLQQDGEDNGQVPMSQILNNISFNLTFNLKVSDLNLEHGGPVAYLNS